MTIEPPVQYYSVAEAARILRMGRSTLYEKAKAGLVDHTVNPAGVIGFTQADIDAALQAGRRPAVA